VRIKEAEATVHTPDERLDLQRPLLQVDAAAARGIADDRLRRWRQLGAALRTGTRQFHLLRR